MTQAEKDIIINQMLAGRGFDIPKSLADQYGLRGDPALSYTGGVAFSANPASGDVPLSQIQGIERMMSDALGTPWTFTKGGIGITPGSRWLAPTDVNAYLGVNTTGLNTDPWQTAQQTAAIYAANNPNNPYYATSSTPTLSASLPASPQFSASASTQSPRPYQEGDPNPYTGTPLNAAQAANLTKQGQLYTPTGSRTMSATISPSGTISPSSDPRQLMSAQELAQYVQSNGITDLQNQSWWANNPNKTQAWAIISGSPLVASAATPAATPALPQGFSVDANGKIILNSGDPAVDAVVNTLVDGMWDIYKGYAGEVPKELTQQEIDALAAQVEKQFGPQLTAARNMIEQKYSTNLDYARQQLSQAMQGYANQKIRMAEDIGIGTKRAQESQQRQLTIQGRNLQEANNDLQFAYQQANRTYSGKRIEDEAKQQQINKENVDLINKSTEQSIQDLNRSQARDLQDIALAEQDVNAQNQYNIVKLDMARTEALQGVDTAKAQKLSELMAYQQGLPFKASEALSKIPDIGNVASLNVPTVNTNVTSTGSSTGSTPPLKTYTPPPLQAQTTSTIRRDLTPEAYTSYMNRLAAKTPTLNNKLISSYAK